MPLSQTSTAMSSLHHEVKSMSWLFPCKIKPMLEVSVVTQSTLSHDPICGARVLGRQAETCEPWDCGSWCYCLSAGPHSVVLHLLFPLFWPVSPVPLTSEAFALHFHHHTRDRKRDCYSHMWSLSWFAGVSPQILKSCIKCSPSPEHNAFALEQWSP